MKKVLLGIVLIILLYNLIACNVPIQSSTQSSSSISSTSEMAMPVSSEISDDINTQSKTVYYVSPTGSDSKGTGSLENPWQSIIKARDFVRTISDDMTSDIHVYLRGGVYSLENPIRFMNADSGNNGFQICYENYEDETPIISGGRVITGWELYDPEKNIYRADVSSYDNFRQLYVNGERAILARNPNLTEVEANGPYFMGGRWNYLNKYETNPFQPSPYTFKVKTENIPDWDGIDPLEIVTVDHWRQKMAHIKTFKNQGSVSTVILKEPEASNGHFSHANQYIPPIYSPYYFQNSFNLLDAEREWYLDHENSIVYFKPRAGESMESIEIIVPQIETILKISSDYEGKGQVEDLVFRGLIFEYSNWTAPDRYGYADIQAANIGTANKIKNIIIPGAIQLRNADNILIEDCTIRHTGANAIVASDFEQQSIVRNCVIQNNTITDLSAGGIYFYLNTPESSNNVIQNNLVEFGGRDYADGVGILLGCTPNTKVLHNEVGHFGYGGISVGWSWDDTVTAAENIEVAFNKVHHVMQLLDDSAGIYSLGNIPGCTIHDNYISNISISKYAGFDPVNMGNIVCGINFDSGSTNIIAFSNVIDNTSYAFSAPNNPEFDYLFRDNFYNCKKGNVPIKKNYSNNTFVDGEWPEAAKLIIDKAGIEIN